MMKSIFKCLLEYNALSNRVILKDCILNFYYVIQINSVWLFDEDDDAF